MKLPVGGMQLELQAGAAQAQFDAQVDAAEQDKGIVADAQAAAAKAERDLNAELTKAEVNARIEVEKKAAEEAAKPPTVVGTVQFCRAETHCAGSLQLGACRYRMEPSSSWPPTEATTQVTALRRRITTRVRARGLLPFAVVRSSGSTPFANGCSIRITV